MNDAQHKVTVVKDSGVTVQLDKPFKVEEAHIGDFISGRSVSEIIKVSFEKETVQTIR